MLKLQNKTSIANQTIFQAVMLDPDYSVTKESPLWTAKFDYKAQGEDELSLRKGQIVVLLSKDAKISGDEVIYILF